jgi:hypothetical protein
MRLLLPFALVALAALSACTDTPVAPPGNPPAPPVTPPTNPPATPPVLPPPPAGQLPAAPAQNIVTYAGGTTGERFNAVVSLSDGTFLVGGQAQNLDWVPTGTPRIALGTGSISSASTGNIGFLAQLSGDFQRVLRVAAFPADTVRDVYRIRLSNLPGQPTGDVFISGSRDGGSSDGYYLAKLNGNFVGSAPTGLSWSYDVNAGGDHKERQPWDVGSDGKVVYALGRPFDTEWAAIQRLSPAGTPEPVEHWTAHWSANGEWDGTPASSAPQAVQYSAVVMKAGRKGSLRSRTQVEFDANLPDGNGRTDRKGTYPDDYYFNAPCPLSGACPSSNPGYTGYKTSGKPTQRVGGIAVDRRDNSIYFGYSTQSVLPDGNPDFEPAVVAMDSSGKLKWWSRLYSERTDKTGGGFNTTSSPDQYVDHLAIDYSTTCTGGCVVVLARAHGNNVINFWSGNKINANPSATGFQNQFTGTSGNIHISWLGKLQLSSGTLQRATWLAEWAEGASLGTPSSEPLMDGWPSPNSGWPNLNTTRAQSLEVDPQGRVFVTALGRRTITTANAQQKMLKPSEGKSAWNAFARVYDPSLEKLVYSSLTVGAWDPVTEQGGGNTELRAVAPLNGGLVAVGVQTATGGVANGNPVPTVRVPPWGASAPSGESALLTAIKF